MPRYDLLPDTVLTDPDQFAAMLHDLVEFYESPRQDLWLGGIPVEFRDRLMRASSG